MKTSVAEFWFEGETSQQGEWVKCQFISARWVNLKGEKWGEVEVRPLDDDGNPGITFLLKRKGRFPGLREVTQ